MGHPLIKQNKIVLVAGVYDVLSAKIPEMIGVNEKYMLDEKYNCME